ncbi:MAG: sugar transferase [Pseudomonadota bacterium]
MAKRAFDVAVAVGALPVVSFVALLVFVLNPLTNRGPLFYHQLRMGRNCKPFTMVKFRTMRDGDGIDRGPDDPVEDNRITPLGRILRRTRIDELPQIINILTGDMSLIGPRPDYWDHAIHYIDAVPGYRERHTVRPGITGLAQVDGGYAEGIHATVEKTQFDMEYITRLGPAMEAYVLMRTVRVVFTGHGAR